MQVKQERNHIVDVLFVLALFVVFTLSALVLVILGANVYRQTVSYMDENYEARTAYSYLTEKVRQNDIYGSVSVGELEGTRALILTREINDATYATYLYLHQGSLRELFIRQGSDIGSDPLSAGRAILPLRDWEPEMADERLLRIDLTLENGAHKQLFISLHSY
ncbi:MAG: DUF4860 domain-containing protein [Lachnospiraceae bacterium]|nr:DUF4860 domain-containing protein [Lachnospiraceae bacterium]